MSISWSVVSKRAVVVFALVFAASVHAGNVTFAKAKKEDAAPMLQCKDPAFMDPRLDDPSVGPRCYSCPEGFKRTANPVTSDEACSKAGTKFSEADFKNHYSCDTSKDEFYDPRKGGECWKCPKDKPRRTLYAVTSDKACATSQIIGEKLGKATFVHKHKDCTDGAFHDPRNGGECWKCPKGSTRTAEPVDSKKACSKSEVLKKAKDEGYFGCPKGSFLDVGTNQCWSCPKDNPYRTISPVNDAKACTNQLVGIVAAAADKEGRAVLCRQVVTAIKKGKEDVEDLKQIIDRYLDPVRKPVEKEVEKRLDEAADYVDDQTKLDEYMGKTIKKVGGETLKTASAFGTAVGNAKEKLEKIILDENLVCNGTPQQVDDALKQLKLVPDTSKLFFSVSATATFTHPTYKGAVTVGMTWVTNLSGAGGLYVSVGLGVSSTQDPGSVDLSAMLFPGTTMGDFGLSAVPSITVSVAKGEKTNDYLKTLPPDVQTMCSAVDALDVAWNFDTKTLPTFGVGKNLFSLPGKGQGAYVDVSAMLGWDIPVLTYKDWKLQ